MFVDKKVDNPQIAQDYPEKILFILSFRWTFFLLAANIKAQYHHPKECSHNEIGILHTEQFGSLIVVDLDINRNQHQQHDKNIGNQRTMLLEELNRNLPLCKYTDIVLRNLSESSQFHHHPLLGFGSRKAPSVQMVPMPISRYMTAAIPSRSASMPMKGMNISLFVACYTGDDPSKTLGSDATYSSKFGILCQYQENADNADQNRYDRIFGKTRRKF